MSGPLRSFTRVPERSAPFLPVILHRPLSKSFPLLLTAFSLAVSCGLTEPLQNPDEILRIRNLNPRAIVSHEHYASEPDSTGGTDPIYLRYSLSTVENQAVEGGAIVEGVLRVPPEQIYMEGWIESTGLWSVLVDRTEGGTDSLDIWWRKAWIEQTLSRQLISSDNRIRLRISPGTTTSTAYLRVVDSSPGLWLKSTPGSIIAASDGNLLIMDSNSIHRWSVDGNEVDQVPSANPPSSLCRQGESYFGTTPTEIRRLPVSGGTWQIAAQLPWTVHGGTTLTAGTGDLYLIRYPAGGSGGSYPVLYRLSADILVSTYSFFSALQDSFILRRNGMPGGNGSGFAWWEDDLLLVAPGTQQGEYGLVTFTRAGRFRDFIPLPFEEGDIQLAITGSYLFITSASPTLEALAWSPLYRPAPPGNGLIYRWPVP